MAYEIKMTAAMTMAAVTTIMHLRHVHMFVCLLLMQAMFGEIDLSLRLMKLMHIRLQRH